ncbi:inositol monophosphatase family protein [Thiolinea disciformis]|uniref:inositol monophosphatase family protein n=1 Tax=Thiolinea disciformis TaxID=125614 RepID=UPI00036F9FF6|nr:inositol monophosphatase family protein [Thiolinea disciformis]
MPPDLASLAALVRDISRAEILPRFEQVSHQFKQDGSLVTDADLAVHQKLCAALQTQWPDIAFLSEEMDKSEQEQLLRDAEWLWCLDPLDGTSNFAAGIPLFASSLALLHQGQVALGITYDPIRDELFTANHGQGAWLNGKRLICQASPLKLENAVALIDFKRLKNPLRAALFEHKPFGSQRNLGTCALELAWIAANRGQAYLHGGMKLWDIAVGALLITEAGGHIASIDGSPAFEPSLKVHSAIAAPDPLIFVEWQAFVQAHRA